MTTTEQERERVMTEPGLKVALKRLGMSVRRFVVVELAILALNVSPKTDYHTLRGIQYLLEGSGKDAAIRNIVDGKRSS